jgi:RNA polymerase sigma-70 factor (ECF subfamily)
MENEKELVESVIKGQSKDIRRFIDTYQHLISHVVFKMISNPTDREDCCQEIMIKTVRNLPEFRFESKLSTWIARIAYHRCINYLQKKKVTLYHDQEKSDMGDDDASANIEERFTESVWSPETDNSDEKLNRKDMMEQMYKAIDTLTPVYRTILTLYHMDEMSYSEIGQITQLPEGTVKSYLFRARKQLKERLLSIHQEEEWAL